MHYIFVGVMIGIGLMLAPLVLFASVRLFQYVILPVVLIAITLASLYYLMSGIIFLGTEAWKDPAGALELVAVFVGAMVVGFTPFCCILAYNRLKERIVKR